MILTWVAKEGEQKGYVGISISWCGVAFSLTIFGQGDHFQI